ncbi:Uncharacterized protein QTN25_005395 [Entamoeba marina]
MYQCASTSKPKINYAFGSDLPLLLNNNASIELMERTSSELEFDKLMFQREISARNLDNTKERLATSINQLNQVKQTEHEIEELLSALTSDETPQETQQITTEKQINNNLNEGTIISSGNRRRKELIMNRRKCMTLNTRAKTSFSLNSTPKQKIKPEKPQHTQLNSNISHEQFNENSNGDKSSKKIHNATSSDHSKDQEVETYPNIVPIDIYLNWHRKKIVWGVVPFKSSHFTSLNVISNHQEHTLYKTTPFSLQPVISRFDLTSTESYIGYDSLQGYFTLTIQTNIDSTSCNENNNLIQCVIKREYEEIRGEFEELLIFKKKKPQLKKIVLTLLPKLTSFKLKKVENDIALDFHKKYDEINLPTTYDVSLIFCSDTKQQLSRSLVTFLKTFCMPIWDESIEEIPTQESFQFCTLLPTMEVNFSVKTKKGFEVFTPSHICIMFVDDCETIELEKYSLSKIILVVREEQNGYSFRLFTYGIVNIDISLPSEGYYIPYEQIKAFMVSFLGVSFKTLRETLFKSELNQLRKQYLRELHQQQKPKKKRRRSLD